MSTRYGYRCEQCDESGPRPERNSFENLEALHQMWMPVQAVVSSGHFSVGAVAVEGGIGESMEFLRSHAGHDLSVVSEYGKTVRRLGAAAVFDANADARGCCFARAGALLSAINRLPPSALPGEFYEIKRLILALHASSGDVARADGQEIKIGAFGIREG